MPIKLNNLNEIATIIKTKYGNNLNHMNFIFCFKKDNNSYFIFQEIQGMPIKRIIYHESNNSVIFSASWASCANPYAMIVDANYDQIENWKDLQDRSRPYNSFIEGGGFAQGYWKSISRQNKTEKKKKKKHKIKYDTFVEYRVDKICRANFNEWGFELYSSTISMIGICSRHSFPYNVRDVPGSESQSLVPLPPSAPTISYGSEPQQVGPEDEDGASLHALLNKVSWQGGSFHVPEFEYGEKVSQISNPLGVPGGQGCDLSSYWDANECDEENEMFDKEMVNIFLGNKEKNDTILDVGQKQVDLYFGD